MGADIHMYDGDTFRAHEKELKEARNAMYEAIQRYDNLRSKACVELIYAGFGYSEFIPQYANKALKQAGLSIVDLAQHFCDEDGFLPPEGMDDILKILKPLKNLERVSDLYKLLSAAKRKGHVVYMSV